MPELPASPIMRYLPLRDNVPPFMLKVPVAPTVPRSIGELASLVKSSTPLFIVNELAVLVVAPTVIAPKPLALLTVSDGASAPVPKLTLPLPIMVKFVRYEVLLPTMDQV